MAAISECCLNVDADPQHCTVFDITQSNLKDEQRGFVTTKCVWVPQSSTFTLGMSGLGRDDPFFNATLSGPLVTDST